jgi:hypothetical protein
MLPLDDPRWAKLEGGYRMPYDPSPALGRLERGEDVWDELWQELHHQGDVGESSYAAVPQLVRIARSLPQRDYNFYGLVSTIEIERHRKSNPPLPDWLEASYRAAWREVLHLALTDLRTAEDRETIRITLGAVLLSKSDLRLGTIVSRIDDGQIDEYLEEYEAWSELYD